MILIMENKKINLSKGEVLVYDFGNVKVHDYNTCDALNDQVILLEKNGKLVVIELPTFYDNNKELEEYIKSLNVKVDGVLLSYHMSGAHFLEGIEKYATHNADDYGHTGGGKALIDGFIKAFGSDFDGKVHDVTKYIDKGKVTFANIKMYIIPTNDAYDIEIPEINSIYTHMLGSDCHSIITGKDHANLMIETLEGYLKKNYNLILTSHYVPEGISAVKEKIAYLKNIVDISESSNNAEEMMEKVKEAYPNYSGLNYLEMSVNAFFNKK